MKTCSVCKEVKPLDDFHKNKGTKDGLTVTCKPCAKARASAWQKANPDRVSKSQKLAYKRNRERVRETRLADNRRWRERNLDAQRKRVKEYQKANPEIKRISEAKRRSQKLGNGVFRILPKEVRHILAQPCAECGTVEGITLDHIVPISRGGRHSVGNLQPLCATCNSSKNSKYLIEWRATKMLAVA